MYNVDTKRVLPLERRLELPKRVSAENDRIAVGAVELGVVLQPAECDLREGETVFGLSWYTWSSRRSKGGCR
jgi:hypothetical protein